MNKKYKEEMQEIHASEDLIKNTINKINLKNRRKSYEFVKKFALGAAAMMMVSVTSFAAYMVATGKVSSYIKKEFKDEYGTMTHNIPQIDIESEDAESMNEDIKEKYETLYKEAVENLEEGASVITTVDYKAYENGEILSVVAYKTYPGGNIYYSTYNINTVTGEKVENKELLEMKDLTEEEVQKEIIAYMEERVKSAKYEGATESEIKEIQQTLLEGVYSTKVDENTMFYLNDENHLCVVATEYVLAGAGEYERLYDLEEHKILEAQYNLSETE